MGKDGATHNSEIDILRLLLSDGIDDKAKGKIVKYFSEIDEDNVQNIANRKLVDIAFKAAMHSDKEISNSANELIELLITVQSDLEMDGLDEALPQEVPGVRALSFPVKIQSSYDDMQAIYSLYLVINEYLAPFRKIHEFIEMIAILGDSLDDVIVNTPRRNAFSRTKEEVLKRFEKHEIYDDLKNTIVPYMLITNVKLSEFRPIRDHNRYQILLFPDALSNPILYLSRIIEIENAFKTEDDFFDWFDRKKKVYKREDLILHIWDALRLSPGVGGLHVDVKKLLIRTSGAKYYF